MISSGRLIQGSLFDADLEEMVLADLIDNFDFEFINPSHAHELSVLHNSLVFNKLIDGWGEGLEEILSSDQARSEVSLDMIRKRVTEVSRLFDAYDDKLESENAMSQALKTSRLVGRLEDLVSERSLSIPKKVYFIWFYHLTASLQKTIGKDNIFRWCFHWVSKGAQYLL